MESTFGTYIKQRRKELGFPMRKVASHLKMDTSTLGKIEREERAISIEKIVFLCEILETPKEELFNYYYSSKLFRELKEYENYENVLEIVNKQLTLYKNKQQQFKFDKDWREKEFKFPKRKTKIATLFSGIGAIEYAFKRLKLDTEIIFASDIDKFVKQSYFENYNISEERWYNDVRELDGKKYKNEIDILVGGSPCQSFSMVGKRKGLDDTRGTLFYEFARIVKESQPKIFIYENVKGLINHDKGNTFEIMKATFDELGYRYFYQVMNAKNYGVPQHRERIFVVGFKDKKVNFSFPEPVNLEPKMQDFLEDYTDSKYYLSEKGVKFVTSSKNRKKRYTQINGDIAICQKANQQFNWHGDFIFESIEKPEFDELIFDVNEVEEKYYLSEKTTKYVLSEGTKNFKTKIKTDLEVARPLLQSMHKMHRAGVDNYVTHNKGRIRKLTPKECLRLMGFRDDFKQVVSDTQMYRQAGNSIVVDVLISLLKQIDITKYAEANE
ncbi:DNA (cytosine-5-)-methyltransferase [Tenacibaculum finnmarkense]|uniref:DNA (cytosine-5-)-methyltransferase n=1 Tax=Tenacibaculum finnmarkense TaxID=2781243 RepID=UPI001E63E38F|nr:DNA (cytosine-5-)-methyltransferase [Tenacibaculum finnmarkense]MCD8423586.1 DNA (cytosine-5-)-methyltransferase [Tenacibaculum finnmarkense genomovar ulcerans]MCG8239778.1 DNA (cytosine-5-)-methyltransferase [Tenacibaculum finnmarkense genomovar ulcerans]